MSRNTRPMKCPMTGRQPRHHTTPAFTRERARRPPTPALLPWTSSGRLGRGCCSATNAAPCGTRAPAVSDVIVVSRPKPPEGRSTDSHGRRRRRSAMQGEEHYGCARPGCFCQPNAAARERWARRSSSPPRCMDRASLVAPAFEKRQPKGPEPPSSSIILPASLLDSARPRGRMAVTGTPRRSMRCIRSRRSHFDHRGGRSETMISS